MEPYLYHVMKPKYRIAIAMFRCISHILEIERGRQTNPKTLVADRNVYIVMWLKTKNTSC